MAIEYDLSQDITQNPFSLDPAGSEGQPKTKGLALDIPMPSVKPTLVATDQANRQDVAEADALSKRFGVPSPVIGTDLFKYRKLAQSQDADIAYST